MSGETLRLRQGGLYLARAICEKYFLGLESVILLRREQDLLVLPVRHAAAGGYLLKQRNGAGDRVVFAPDFFRQNGIEDAVDRDMPIHWDSMKAALVVTSLFHAN